MKHLLLFILLSLPALAQQPLRICTYNVLNFSDQTSGERIAALESVLDEIVPSIFVAHEIAGQAGAIRFQNDVLQFVDSRLRLGPFIDGPDSDNAIYVDTTQARVIAHSIIKTSLRNADGWLVVVNQDDTLLIVGCHLKAADDTASRSQRAEEAMNIRSFFSAIGSEYPYVLVGDLNVYTSTEVAYQTFTSSGAGQLIDPINRPGTWHNNDAYADIHTQATHDSIAGGFISGGVDDRFDFILLSPTLMPKYQQGTYTAFGNDAQHFNKSINAEPANSVVSQAVANALFNASDHLPVYLELMFQASSGVQENHTPSQLNLSEVAPNPLNSFLHPDSYIDSNRP